MSVFGDFMVSQAAKSDEAIEKLRSIQRELIIAWECFHANLPDGEYKGLGEMRIAIRKAKGEL